MNIKEASAKTGISKDMIRFYEKKGLIHPARYKNSYRNYSDHDLFQLVTIRQYSVLGIKLDTIKSLMSERKTDAFLSELEETRQSIKEEENILKQRMEFTNHLHLLFHMYKQSIPFIVQENEPFYYYQRKDIQEYATLYAYQCARPILRIKKGDLNLEAYHHYDQGKLFLKKVKHNLDYDYYPKEMYYQVVRNIPPNVLVDGKIIKPLLQEMKENGYEPCGDLFLFQMAGNSKTEPDLVSISVACKSTQILEKSHNSIVNTPDSSEF